MLWIFKTKNIWNSTPLEEWVGSDGLEDLTNEEIIQHGLISLLTEEEANARGLELSNP